MAHHNLTRDIDKQLDIAITLSEMIEAEIERLFIKREQRVEEINNLQEQLPKAKDDYSKMVKTFGHSETTLNRKTAIKAKRTVYNMVKSYKEAEQSLGEIESAISVLEEGLS